MKGFFRKDQLQTTKKRQRLRKCGACQLKKGCRNPALPVSGEGGKEILVISEAPNAEEDRVGEYLIGKAGQELGATLKEQGIDLDKDCWKTSAVCCKTPRNKKPTKQEIEHCNPGLVKVLQDKKPKIVLLLGGIALDSFLLGRWKKAPGGIQKWRGFTIPDQDYKCWVLPVYHPSYVSRAEKDQSVVSVIWENDLAQLSSLLKTPFPDYSNYEEMVFILETKEQVTKYLEDIIKYKPKFLAFDYETTGLKPDAKGHKIASVSMCWQKERACSWEWKLTPRKLFKQIMSNPKIGKGASNAKMEHHWSAKRAGVEVLGWMWDTMNTAHVLDNRKGITGLKFNVYSRFGIPDYDSEIAHYLKSSGANGLNRVFEAPRDKLLKYGGADSLFTFWTAWEQMEEIEVL